MGPESFNLNWVHCMAILSALTNLFPIKSIVGLFYFAVHCQTPTSILTENFITGLGLQWTLDFFGIKKGELTKTA